MYYGNSLPIIRAFVAQKKMFCYYMRYLLTPDSTGLHINTNTILCQKRQKRPKAAKSGQKRSFRKLRLYMWSDFQTFVLSLRLQNTFLPTM